MARIIEDTFDRDDLGCPVCGLSLVPPIQEYCEHIAFYCVLGPVDDPFIEYQEDGISLDLDNISSDEKWLKIGIKYTLTIYRFTELDAH